VIAVRRPAREGVPKRFSLVKNGNGFQGNQREINEELDD